MVGNDLTGSESNFYQKGPSIVIESFQAIVRAKKDVALYPDFFFLKAPLIIPKNAF